ncbi:zinc ribbon domain-containing protein [Methanobrevibacter ruminantium]|uniref:zinc ribbon domain-containing protein n=1 Tax=Methanobrevibacter ruminantium TaxID=83816 RepID=UPI003EFC6CEF
MNGGVRIETNNIRYFYRNIVKSGKKYRIKYNNKDYGEFSKLSDALYERDCLFYCKFDYDLLVECDLPNKYENMDLPPFPESRPRGRIEGNLKFKKDLEGEIVFNHKERKFCVIRGEENYGQYDTMVEAYFVKKTLMEHDWDRACLIQNRKIREDIFLNQKVKSTKPQLPKYCPQCGNRVKEEDTVCKICGIKLHGK